MPLAVTRQQRQELAIENLRFPVTMTEIPKDDLARMKADTLGATPIRCWRSRHFIATLWLQPCAGFPNTVRRLTIHRASITPDGEWKDGIAWTELERIKNECGFAGEWAVECYPPADQVIDIANMRHLFLPFLHAQVPEYGWISGKAQKGADGSVKPPSDDLL
jgi:hypothetical protein